MPEYKKETNKIHKITLESKIVYVMWGSLFASVGDQVVISVFTHFVGNGSKIEIKIKDKSGKCLEKVTGQIYNNSFVCSINVPDKARDELIFTAKLPKHGLEKESLSLKIILRPEIFNARWDKEEVTRGEILKLTAETKNIPNETEVMIHIYEHDFDDAHDFITRFPARVKLNKIETEWRFEYHDNASNIPTYEEMKKIGRSYTPPEYFFWIISGSAKTKSGLIRFKDWIEIELVYHEGTPVSNEEFVVTFADGAKKKGNLDRNGFARLEKVPPGKFIIEYPDLNISSWEIRRNRECK
ncbi:MAG: hypothetical protein A3G23_13560 [Bacteroidetes bacterium RIFCSPLOWO2_12_FULL_37_12]|nr:MAG: hypothetical protein A3G23_13560 [Bacteroidetes bacterium RIFCSPLOWO2_12_FULL_37_12]